MLRRALVAEFLGSLLLACVVIGSGILAERLAAGNAAVALGKHTGDGGGAWRADCCSTRSPARSSTGRIAGAGVAWRAAVASQPLMCSCRWLP